MLKRLIIHKCWSGESDLRLAAYHLFSCRRFVTNSDTLLRNKDLSALRMYSFRHKLQFDGSPLCGLAFLMMDHPIEKLMLLSFKSHMNFERNVSWECLRCLTESLWLLNRILNGCSVIPI